VTMQRRVAKHIERFVTVSSSSRHDIAEQMGVPESRMSVVPVGVDETVFRPSGAVRVRGRLMVTTSSDVPMKGLVPLLEALAVVRRERPDAHLVVIGKLREGSRVPAVLERLGLGVGDAVRFVSGVPEEEIVRLYGEAELAVVPSLYEGFSLPAIEAMACGTPLVAYRRGSVPEIVDHGSTGYIVDDVDSAVDAVGRVGWLNRGDCRLSFERRFDAARMTRDYLEVYRKVAADERACAPRAVVALNVRRPARPTAGLLGPMTRREQPAGVCG
jgi:glycosyltransferase involved in cell wall biosynthesis